MYVCFSLYSTTLLICVCYVNAQWMKNTTCRECRKVVAYLSTLHVATRNHTGQSALQAFRARTDTKTPLNTITSVCCTDVQMKAAMPAITVLRAVNPSHLYSNLHQILTNRNMRTHQQKTALMFRICGFRVLLAFWGVHLTLPCARNTYSYSIPKRDEVGATTHTHTHTNTQTHTKHTHNHTHKHTNARTHTHTNKYVYKPTRCTKFLWLDLRTVLVHLQEQPFISCMSYLVYAGTTRLAVVLL